MITKYNIKITSVNGGLYLFIYFAIKYTYCKQIGMTA